MGIMIVDGYQFMTDCVTKFHNTIYIAGWFHHPSDELRSVTIIDRDVLDSITAVGLPHGGV
jgi:hypothetical protein